MPKIILTIFTLFALNTFVFSQNLEDLLDNQVNQENKTQEVRATFKSVQLINSHTVKMPAEKQLIFLISHRFGYLNSGFSDLFGLDAATVRFGFEYGINKDLALGFGRSTYKRNYDLFAKYTVLKQSRGAKNIPFTLSLLGVGNISSAKWPDDGRDYLFAHRMSYTAQLLLARKFSNQFSLQLMPSYVHHNLVENRNEKNDLVALGVGARMKISSWVALIGEYHLPIYGLYAEKYTPPLSLGMSLETGGHVFQLFFTNTSAIYETGYISETRDRWANGNIRFGFNISRTF